MFGTPNYGVTTTIGLWITSFMRYQSFVAYRQQCLQPLFCWNLHILSGWGYFDTSCDHRSAMPHSSKLVFLMNPEFEGTLYTLRCNLCLHLLFAGFSACTACSSGSYCSSAGIWNRISYYIIDICIYVIQLFLKKSALTKGRLLAVDSCWQRRFVCTGSNSDAALQQRWSWTWICQNSKVKSFDCQHAVNFCRQKYSIVQMDERQIVQNLMVA